MKFTNHALYLGHTHSLAGKKDADNEKPICNQQGYPYTLKTPWRCGTTPGIAHTPPAGKFMKLDTAL